MSVAAAPRSGPSVVALLRRPGYRGVVLGSFLWHTQRWGSLFAVTLLLTRQGASAMHIELIGALFFAPLLLGAVAANALAATAPRAVVLTVQLVLLPAQAAMAAFVALGSVPVWMTATLMLLVGVGNAVDMTSRRMLVQDVAGDRHAPVALKLEPVLSGVGVMVGSFGTGVIVDRLGAPAAFGVIAALDAACVVLTLRLAAPPHRRPEPAAGARSPRALAVIRATPGLAAMIGVTLVMNLCIFGYTSLVPKLAEHFTASATVAGLLTAASGVGQLAGGLVIASVAVRRRGRVLFAGSGVAVAGVWALTVAPSAAVACACLLVAGLGQSGFSAMQSMIAVGLPDGSLRTVALGAVSTAVGALPLGMVLIGALSEGFGVRGGLMVAASIGMTLLIWLAVACRRSPRAAVTERFGM